MDHHRPRVYLYPFQGVNPMFIAKTLNLSNRIGTIDDGNRSGRRARQNLQQAQIRRRAT